MKNIHTPPPTTDEIAAAAYLIWETEGRPSGRDLEHWFQAEKQLIATRQNDDGQKPPAKPRFIFKPRRQAVSRLAGAGV